MSGPYADTVPALGALGANRTAIKRREPLQRLHYFLFYLDTFSFSVIGCLLFFALPVGNAPSLILIYATIITAFVIFYVSYAFASDFYDWRRFRRMAARPLIAFRAAVFSFGCLLLIGFVLKETATVSRLWGASWMLGVFAYILISRAFLTGYFARAARQGLHARKAVIVGAGEVGREVLEHIRRFDDQTINVVGFLDDRVDRIPAAVRGVPVLGGTAAAERLVHEEGVDLILMALPWSARDRITELVRQLSVWAADIYMAPDKLGLRYADRPVFRMAGMTMLNLKDRPISEWNAVVKRIEDLCLAVPALIILSPLLIAVAIAIKLESRGPVLFKQDRLGFNNDPITVFKFRSMYSGQTDVHCARQTSRNDSRVTRVGRIIRRTNIDELPQLLNVLKGDMSVIGPRPHARLTKAGGRFLHEVVAGYASRHRVKPGMTGWAQCNGWRGETDTEDKILRRVEHDLYYIENWSIFLDFEIIARTAWQVARGHKNAY